MREVGGHQHRISGREGAGLTVAHAGVDQMGPLTRAAAVTADGQVKGWRIGRGRSVSVCVSGWTECDAAL